MSESTNPVVTIETSKGTMTATLWADRAPATIANFLKYVDEKHYDDTIFHRVIKGFMIQGGGMAADMSSKPSGAPVVNEATADKKNLRGTLAMARTSDINSATAQFFINHADSDFLDHRDETPSGFGYCVFGELTDGLDVLDAIAAVPTGRRGPHDDVPTEPITIQSISR